MLRKDLRKALELLRLQFQLGSSPAGSGWVLSTMELLDTAGVRNEALISSQCEEDLRFRVAIVLWVSSGNELGRL